MKRSLRAWALSHPGQKRQNNEDAHLADRDAGLFLVCDGMGGHAAGEHASAIAVETVRSALTQQGPLLERYDLSDDAERPRLRLALRAVLARAVEAASAEIFRQGEQDLRFRGMGTTASLLWIVRDRAYIAHVGDSRIYLRRNGAVHQLTEDHTVLAELLRRDPHMDRAVLERLPYRHSLSRAVGAQAAVQVDTLDLELLPNDRFVLCSDGLHGYFDEPEALGGLLDAGPLEQAAQRFIEFANAAGGKDNITALVVDAGRPLAQQPAVGDTIVEQHRFSMEGLKAIRLFQHLSYKELIALLNITEAERFAPGTVVIREGEHGDQLYLIVQGHCEVDKGGETVATLQAGDHFGEMALVDRFPRSATVRTLAPTEVRSVRRGPFYELLRADPLLSNKVMWNIVQVLSARLRDTSNELEELRRELVPRDTAPDILQPRRP